MKKSKIPTVAGILMLTASAFNIIWLATAFTQVIDPKEVLRFMWVISPLPYFGVAAAFGNNTVVSNVLIVIFVLGILVSILGGVFALRRKGWGLALGGSIGALLYFPILGIAAFILIVMSRRSYSGKEES